MAAAIVERIGGTWSRLYNYIHVTKAVHQSSKTLVEHTQAWQACRLQVQSTQASIFILTRPRMERMLQLAPHPERQRTARCCAHARMDHLRGSARWYRSIGDAVCKVKQASLLMLKVRRRGETIWKWKASFFVQPTTLHGSDPASLDIHTSTRITPSIKQLVPDSPAVVQAHLITAKV
jgi:hypothetical protein